MTRAAWISGALDVDTRAELASELEHVLPGDDNQRRAFVQAADEALDEHRKLLEPIARAAELEDGHLEKLAKAGQAFEDAMERLGPDTRHLLRIGLWSTTGKTSDPPSLASVAAAAKLCGVTATAAEHLRETDRKHRMRRARGSIDALVKRLAFAYGTVFGERPSAAAGGIFAAALAQVLTAGGITDRNGKPATLGEKRLRRILDRTHIDVPPPRRGRKRRH